MSRLAAFKASTSLSDLARLLSLKPSTLSYILYKQPETKKYTTFQIPKRNGGHRTIKAPVNALKFAQRRLSDLLQDCVEEININKHRKDRIAHGFKRKRSIITNARQHRHRRYVFNLDLEDFFPSINLGRVLGFLIKNRDFELHKNVATVVAQIACHDNSLPQGSPCSPVISNLIAHLLDMRLVSLAAAASCTYSRYADDLTFSTNKREFPANIAVPSGTGSGELHQWTPAKELQKIIERTGFRINTAKTHRMYRTSRQDVTGLVVNKKINVSWEYRHNVRAMVHSLVTTGEFECYGIIQKDEQEVLDKKRGTLNKLHGMLGFIDSIYVYNKTETQDSPSNDLSSAEKTYQKFLIYSNFYAAESPVVICEGPTDNIYLTHAMRSLASQFPDLAEVQNDKIRLKARLYKYPNSSTARLLNLTSGGSGSLRNFIGTYRKITKHFSGPGLKNAVIILFDNDSGAGAIKSVIRNVSKVSVTGTEPFVHVVKNLYAVPTPLVGSAKKSKIEDYFDETVRQTVIDGKSFSDSNDFDTEKHYGKKVFAHRVVRPKADTINFAGFSQLLTNIVGAINAHKAMMS